MIHFDLFQRIDISYNVRPFQFLFSLLQFIVERFSQNKSQKRTEYMPSYRLIKVVKNRSSVQG
jgi:hypothetical protein